MTRSTILSGVRKANEGRSLPLERMSAVLPPPADTQTTKQAFVERMTACGVVIEDLASMAHVPDAVLRYLTASRLPLVIRHGADKTIAAMPWDETSSIKRMLGAAAPDDQAALSRATSGIAETGTLLLASGADNPVTLAFLPDLHIVVLESANIVATMDEAFCLGLDRGDEDSSAVRHLPRTLNLISGASRTGDIGGRLVMGAHGPRQLVVLIADG